MGAQLNRYGFVCALAALILFSPTAYARRGNPPAGHNGSTASGGDSCRHCHGDNTGPGSVQIFGVPRGYEPGTVYDLAIRVTDEFQLGAGFQLSVEDPSGNFVGTLMTVDGNSQLNSGWINHTSTGVSASTADWSLLGNLADFAVQWQAPDSDIGPVTFWAAGNAINNNGILTGDVVYLSDVTIGPAGAEIPTVSEWGLIVMTLLLITAATMISFRRSSKLA